MEYLLDGRKECTVSSNVVLSNAFDLNQYIVKSLFHYSHTLKSKVIFSKYHFLQWFSLIGVNLLLLPVYLLFRLGNICFKRADEVRHLNQFLRSPTPHSGEATFMGLLSPPFTLCQQ